MHKTLQHTVVAMQWCKSSFNSPGRLICKKYSSKINFTDNEKHYMVIVEDQKKKKPLTITTKTTPPKNRITDKEFWSGQIGKKQF